MAVKPKITAFKTLSNNGKSYYWYCILRWLTWQLYLAIDSVSSKYILRLYEALRVRRLVWVFSGSTCYFIGFAVHRLIYSCGARRFKCPPFVVLMFYQGWIMHKARKIIFILNQIAILPRADNSTVKNQGLSFLFIPHGLDEIYLSGIFPYSCMNLSQVVIELWPYIHKLNWLRENGRTNTMFIGWSLSTGHAMCWR